MAIDPSQFVLHNVTDTCAVWNVLSSQTLHKTAALQGVRLCCTDFVRYECLVKPWSPPKDENGKLKAAANALLQDKLRIEMETKQIKAYSLTVEDLQQVEILRKRMNLSKGELTSIAFAMKTNQAFLTDDQNARKLSADFLPPAMTQTTPHLFAWLLFHRHLTDSDKTTVIDQHKASGRDLAPHLENAYRIALEGRYRNKTTS